MRCIIIKTTVRSVTNEGSCQSLSVKLQTRPWGFVDILKANGQTRRIPISADVPRQSPFAKVETRFCFGSIVWYRRLRIICTIFWIWENAWTKNKTIIYHTMFFRLINAIFLVTILDPDDWVNRITALLRWWEPN